MQKARVLTLVASLSATVLVASALAQQPSNVPPAGGAGNFYYVPQATTYVNDAGGGTYHTIVAHPGSNDNPAARKLAMEEASLAQNADGLSKQLAAADNDSKRDELKSKLSDVLGKQFDARQQRHKLEIDSLEAKVKKLKELVAKRQESRGEIISRRLEQVVRDGQGLGW